MYNKMHPIQKMDVEQNIVPPWKNNQPSCDIAASIEI